MCDHEDIPQSDKKRGNKKWPIFVLSPTCKISVDKNADRCHVVDVCVHPTVMQECTADTTGETTTSHSVSSTFQLSSNMVCACVYR